MVNTVIAQISTQEKAVVYFYVDWCSICDKMTPIYNNTANLDIFQDVPFFKVNCEKLSVCSSQLPPDTDSDSCEGIRNRQEGLLIRSSRHLVPYVFSVSPACRFPQWYPRVYRVRDRRSVGGKSKYTVSSHIFLTRKNRNY